MWPIVGGEGSTLSDGVDMTDIPEGCGRVRVEPRCNVLDLLGGGVVGGHDVGFVPIGVVGAVY
jgi:hypothetical protein